MSLIKTWLSENQLDYRGRVYQLPEEPMNDTFLIYMESQRNKAKRQRAEQSRESAQRSTKS